MAAYGFASHHSMRPPSLLLRRATPSPAQPVRPVRMRHGRTHPVRTPGPHPDAPFVRVDGLDGLRGIAVLAVLVFHLWPTLLPGGFIGVTLFFALSGFLITSIIIHEIESTGSLSLRRFYTRRVRRLMPVSLATLAVIVVGWSLAGWLTADLRRDLFFSLGQSANWGHVMLQERYGVDATASPVLHFWSLAIEEQIYLVLPLALLLCHTRRRAQLAVSIGLALSILAVVQASGSASVTYYSTFTRGGEVLLGALVALTLRGRKWETRAARAVAFVLAVTGLAALCVIAMRTDVSTPWFANGGLLVCAGLAVVVIAAISGSPRLGQAVDWWVLARLGQISYAVYLFHWPLLQTFRRSSMDPRVVPWATAVTAIALALASERWFEHPIRSGAVGGRRLAVAALCTAMVVPIVGLVGISAGTRVTNFEAVAADLDEVIASRTATPATDVPVVGDPSLNSSSSSRSIVIEEPEPGSYDHSPTTTSPEAAATNLEPLSIGFFGDSKALTLGLGTARGALPNVTVGTSFTGLGCPLGRGGKVREAAGGAVYDIRADCDWTTGIPDHAAETGSIDVAVVWSGTWDVVDRKVPALGSGWTSVADAEYRQWLLGEMVALNDTIMMSTGATKVLWLTVPIDPASPHPERFAEWTALLVELQVQRPDTVVIVDIAAFVAASGEANRLLPDGVHSSFGADDPAVNSGAELTERLILPVLTTSGT